MGFAGQAGAREHRLVLERGRVHLAVAVALEDGAEGVGDGANLPGLVGEHVTGAGWDGMDHGFGFKRTTATVLGAEVVVVQKMGDSRARAEKG